MIGFDNCQGFLWFPIFSDRLKFFRSQRELSQQELANAVGISRKQVSDYEVGTSKPRQSTYMKILDVLGVTDQEFLGGKILVKSESPLILKIPVYNWVSVIAINSNGANPDSYIYIDSSILKRTSTNGLFAMSIGGISMYPHYKDGDFVIADTNLNSIRDGFLYILSINDEPTIKQCFKQPNGGITLHALNSNFPSFEVDLSEINVIGEVIFKMGFA